jgi:hypothetical protein
MVTDSVNLRKLAFSALSLQLAVTPNKALPCHIGFLGHEIIENQ